jgi:hypothetical protein
MEKTSIALAWKNGEMTILATGDADAVLAAYRKAEQDESNDFVGMLRKPQWYKRNTPSRNKVRHEESLKLAELRDVEDSSEEAKAAAEKAHQEALAEYEAKIEMERLEAIREAAQARLNETLAKMEETERAQQAAKDDENLALAEASVVEVAPSTEMEKAAKKKK